MSANHKATVVLNALLNGKEVTMGETFRLSPKYGYLQVLTGHDGVPMLWLVCHTSLEDFITLCDKTTDEHIKMLQVDG